MKHRTDYPEAEYKTKKQWIKEGFYPDENKGTQLWSNPYHNAAPIYYLPNEVHPLTPEEKAVIKEENKVARTKYIERQKERQRQRIDNLKSYYENKMEREVFVATHNKAAELSNECIKMANLLPAVECINPSKIVVFDTETTGLSSEYDEILQISVIDGEGNELINSYVKPYWNDSWDEAEKIHGISKDMVSDAPYLHELIPKIKGIFDSAELLIAYNNSLDISFIEKTGINLSDKKQYDVMQAFAPYYGAWNDYYGSFTWQKLSTAASYFNHEFKAHDALEDVHATLHCYNCLKELEDSGKYDEVVERNYGYATCTYKESTATNYDEETTDNKSLEESKSEEQDKEKNNDKNNLMKKKMLMGKSR